ncbi:sulfotransferase family 2 domain-containing protein [Spiribacter halobius]|uniref:Sulfotransferase n=1 Tax=Sediminicurvatus halobius TaxID=2182432 RepID=A0A2U2N7F3_9GAMM|nr:sulfotransferase family 2 domain-containing protein [Spiribacter halobius]PWG64904.1 sulfotransferase [Spiribacter halobius]UEX78239.1 sulfotransferase family protein [Spiribacter halobius]
MLISYSHRFLFVHIAKTGGTSIRAALRRYRWGWPYTAPLALCSVMSQMTRPKHALGIKFPRHAKAIAAKEMLPAEVYEGLFKFAVVRNPWDLQVSSFHHLRREHPQRMEGIGDFAAFLRHKFDPARDTDYLFDISQERQWEYLCDLEGRRIVDYVARYENLEADFREACARIGIEPPPLPHRRKAADRRGYRDYYDDDLRALVAKHYARDIEEFGYSF